MNFYLKNCIKGALAGGKAIKDYRAKKVKTKEDMYVGHHAVVSGSDYKSQKAILKALSGDKESFFITEENVKDKRFRERLISAEKLESLRSSRVYIIDELDGSSSFSIGHYEWAISIGYVDKLLHKAGAIFAPKINGGTLFYASSGKGAYMKNGDKTKRIEVANRNLRDSYVIVGPDCFFTKYPKHNKLLTRLGDKARTMNVNGSCALALGLVASGRADALVQPLQCPWDWAAGKLIVEEARGKIIFYEMHQGSVKPLDSLEYRHYNPERREAGFIAGNPKLTDIIVDMLV